MVALSPEKIRSEILNGLRDIGYRGGLLAENYRFPDYFSPRGEEREVIAAAFSQTPISYDSACIGVVEAREIHGPPLIDRHRALGAPVILELAGDVVREWAVSGKSGAHGLIDQHGAANIRQLFAARASVWEPSEFLRAKNIGTFQWSNQLNLFAGLLPELEEQIQEKLDPLLRDALSKTKSEYETTAGKAPDEAHLFQLVFWLLTAKVFHDRSVGKFSALSSNSDVDEILSLVAVQYGRQLPRLLNRQSRVVAASRIWREMDFRNLSVEVLSLIWSTTLVDPDIRKKLGIHRTSRSIVRYVVGRLQYKSSDENLIVLEPCSGSGAFLVGAMNEIRHRLFGMTPADRHRYFTKHLAGIEKESFGVEISRLALTLADFPNPDGWNIVHGDVFDSDVLRPWLQRSGVVLCNPPFEDIDVLDRDKYDLESVLKPAEILLRVLRDLHPSGVLGFVLPRGFMDRSGYAEARRQIAERFARVELTLLPDRAFEADHETVLLIATDPVPHTTCRVINRVVADSKEAWHQFEVMHQVSSESKADRSPSEAAISLSIPELPEVWAALRKYRVLGECADLHRGIEWNELLIYKGHETGNRQKFVHTQPSPGFMRGVAPKTVFSVFETPQMAYLDMRESSQRGYAYERPWNKPKVIVNKARRSRGAWRMSAFPDEEGVTCYQTYIGVWPKSSLDIWVLSAIINSPLANAFIATRESRDVTIETLGLLPIPYLNTQQMDRIRTLVLEYRRLTRPALMKFSDGTQADRILRYIDAEVLDGYHLPPRQEHALLEFLRGSVRPTPFDFGPYLPQGEDVYFSLSERLSPRFKESTAAALLKRMALG